MAIGGLEIAGVVPPFGAVVGMIEVIARELVIEARLCGLVLRTERQDAQEQPTRSRSSLFLMDHLNRIQPGRDARGIKAGEHGRQHTRR